ncbi:MAG: PKD domain-containing protein [Marmoricola sp.]
MRQVKTRAALVGIVASLLVIAAFEAPHATAAGSDAPAGARTAAPKTVGPHGVIHGSRWQTTAPYYDQTAQYPLDYFGGPVVHKSKMYIVYWDPMNLFPSSYTDEVTQFEKDVAADSGKTTNVYSVLNQYGDTTGPINYDVTFGNALVDSTPYPARDPAAYGGFEGGSGCDPLPGDVACVNETDIVSEVSSFLTNQGIQSSPDLTVAVALPPGVYTCFHGTNDGQCAGSWFCAYHDALVGPDTSGQLVGQFPFIVLPSPQGVCPSQDHPNGTIADDAVNFLSHEQIEMIDDPLAVGGQSFDPNNSLAWYDLNGGIGLGGEIADKCATFIGPVRSTSLGHYNQVINGHPYRLQEEFSNADAAASTDPTQPAKGFGCVQNGVDHPPVARLTATVSGSVVRFDATGSTDPDPGDSIKSYVWSFGDISDPSIGAAGGATMTYRYARPGTYPVQVHVTDSSGATAAAAMTITIRPQTATPTTSFHANMTTTLYAQDYLTGSGQASRVGATTESAVPFFDDNNCHQADGIDASNFPASIDFNLTATWRPSKANSKLPNGSNLCVAYNLDLTNTNQSPGTTFTASGSFAIIGGSGTYATTYGSGTVTGTCSLSADATAITCTDTFTGTTTN